MEKNVSGVFLEILEVRGLVYSANFTLHFPTLFPELEICLKEEKSVGICNGEYCIRLSLGTRNGGEDGAVRWIVVLVFFGEWFLLESLEVVRVSATYHNHGQLDC